MPDTDRLLHLAVERGWITPEQARSGPGLDALLSPSRSSSCAPGGSSPRGSSSRPPEGRDAGGPGALQVFRCVGEVVTATLDGEEVFVEVEGQSRSGRIQFTGTGKSFRILSLETRELE